MSHEPRLIHADCLDALRDLPDSSVDACITDPPYGINFMGKAWDGKAIEEAAQRERDTRREMPPRLTGDPDHPDRRKMTARTGSAFANRAGEAGAYDFSLTGNRAFQQWVEQWGREALRVLKPGGHALVFGGTRTHHRLASGLEDAGFEIRDCLAWMFGSGFPKSLDVAAAVDKTVGAEGSWRREDHPGRTGARVREEGDGARIGQTFHATDDNPDGLRHVYEPGSDEARDWDGWGTALKPAFEPVVVARKPFQGTVARNVLEHGTGALNVDACRVPFRDGDDEAESKVKNRHADFGTEPGGNHVYGDFSMVERENYDAEGRWPANVILDEDAAALLDAQTGDVSVGHWPGSRPSNTFGLGHVGQQGLSERHAGTGGPSRFFYCAKVSRAERNAGLDGFEERPGPSSDYGTKRQHPLKPEGEPNVVLPVRNHHPTVKPIALMRWLIRLVTPPGGVVLDPFMGSGSTGCAAALEGVRFVGIEREDDYMEVAAARIAFWAEHGEDALDVVRAADASDRARRELADAGQLDLLDGLATA